jgi:hypothetical protein
MRHLHMNTSAGGRLTLNVSVDVSHTARFEEGIILATAVNSTDNGMLRLAHNSTIPIAAHQGSFVDGYVRKTGSSAFSFPVGHNDVFAPISISAPGNSSHHFTARYLHEDPDALYNVHAKDPSINNVSRCEHWILDRTNGNSNVTVTLGWQQPRSCELNDPPTLKVARWDGAPWRDHGNGGTSGGPMAGTIATMGVVNSFSPFTLASMGPLNPLPVELLSFDAVDEGDQVRCEWATATERDNDHFVVERSADGGVFLPVGLVMGKGLSLQRSDYSFLDRDPLNGLSYYRLKQVDTDGTATLSHMVAVYRARTTTLMLYPNPATDMVNIRLSDGASERVLLRIMDASGCELLSMHHVPEQGPLFIGNLPQGVYTMLLHHTDGSRSEARFIKQ